MMILMVKKWLAWHLSGSGQLQKIPQLRDVLCGDCQTLTSECEEAYSQEKEQVERINITGHRFSHALFVLILKEQLNSHCPSSPHCCQLPSSFESCWGSSGRPNCHFAHCSSYGQPASRSSSYLCPEGKDRGWC